MCGLAGIIVDRPDGNVVVEEFQKRAIRALAHRGPDSAGSWRSADGCIGLIHTRLSIRDLSVAGTQPMISQSGNKVLVYNGELYGAESRLAPLTSGHRLRGTSDTELLLEACDHSGLPTTLSALRGMFAFALVDTRTGEITLARDPFGIKPLSILRGRGFVAFASEWSALRWLSPPELLHPGAIESFLTFGFFAHEELPLRGLERVRPGETITVDRDLTVRRRVYCSLVDEYSRARELPAVDEQYTLDSLRGAVDAHLVADVPVGVFLSGGIDSTVVASSIETRETVMAFTLQPTGALDELSAAEKTAQHLGLELHATKVSWDDIAAAADRVLSLVDEPIGDSSLVLTHLVSAAAHHHVKCVLTGDGGDEAFGGYNRHVVGPALFRARHAIGAGAGWLERWAGALGSLHSSAADTLLHSQIPRARLQELVEKARAASTAADIFEFYVRLVALSGPESPAAQHAASHLRELLRETGVSAADHLLLCDTMFYMQHDILTKVDRASMLASIEVRVPFVDIELFRTTARLPIGRKIRGGKGKRPLRALLESRELTAPLQRGKTGFGFSVGEVLNGPLRRDAVRACEWLSDLVKANPISTITRLSLVRGEVLRGKAAHHLWAVLALYRWAVRDGDPSSRWETGDPSKSTCKETRIP